MGQTIPALVNGTLYEDMFLVYTDTIITVALTAGPIYVKGLSESGTLYIQLVEKWAGLALPRQFTKK
jgi:hypothetical protein